jgi:S1-C subfamily serine protease
VDADLGAVPLAASRAPGDAVFQRGFGGTRPGEGSVLRRGRVAALRGEIGLSYAVESGDSGSGVLNEAGELVGVTVGRDPTTHKGYAIPAATVRAFLVRPRLLDLHPPLAAKLSPPADPAPAADAPADADGLPATIEIDGKTYTRVPGTREYVREGEAPVMMR